VLFAPSRAPFFARLASRLAEPAEFGDLPSELALGYVGYFGYELEAADGARTVHRSRLPDAVFVAPSRYLVLDHVAQRTWVVSSSDEWVDFAASLVSSLPEWEPLAPLVGGGVDPEPYLVRPRSVYLRDVEACLEYLRQGESYEICLTNTVVLPFEGDPFATYCRQRRANPTPYGAYLRLSDVHVLSSSPERFLAVSPSGVAESRPIKGTAPRSSDPVVDASFAKSLRSSPKTQAENLMIVDLLRNDLGRVCEPGSISVPDFLAVESYATVHQLVSTVRGQLRPSVSAVTAAAACFPPGSMTGAPKVRTMQLLDGLETRARGIYSGALGYFGLAGQADLSVVIRTAVIHRGELTAGAGGAIVLDSDPEEEYAEMLLKAAVPLRGLAVAR
jgi:para-aminobenzoate synthetase